MGDRKRMRRVSLDSYSDMGRVFAERLWMCWDVKGHGFATDDLHLDWR